jgi:hypothetical protein
MISTDREFILKALTTTKQARKSCEANIMRFIRHFRPLLELGRCKEYAMAQKTTENSKRRSKKIASVEPLSVVEMRKDAPAGSLPVPSLEEEIRRRAYELFLERGGTPGHESEDWITAEREVRSRQLQRAG